MKKSSTTLSLKVQPEIRPFLAAIIEAKSRGDDCAVARRTEHYQSVLYRIEMEERIKRENEKRERERGLERQEEEEGVRKRLAEWQEQKLYWQMLGIHFALEDDGYEYMQSTQSSQKGWRRLLSEFAKEREKGRYHMWGGKRDRIRSNQTCGRRNNYRGDKHNCGRKPRKPWFK
jgi:hypothetical protein